VLSLAAVACAAPSTLESEPAAPVAAGRRSGASGQRLALESRARAVEALNHPWVDALQVRVDDVTWPALSEGDGLEVRGRVAVANPWVRQAEKDAWRAEAQSYWEEASAQDLVDAAEQCRRSMLARYNEEVRQSHLRYAAQVAELLRWAEASGEAGGLNALEVAELRLEVKTRQAQAMPWAVPGEDDERFALAPLHLEIALPPDPSAWAERIEAHHPSWLAASAQEERFLRLAERARASALPWLDFVELGYRFGRDDAIDGLGLQVAVTLPFGQEARGEQAHYEARALSQNHLRAGIVAALAWQAHAAAEQLRNYVALGQAMQALLDESAATEALLRQWQEEGWAEVRQVVRMANDVQRAREWVLRRRFEASLQGCVLVETAAMPLTQLWTVQGER